MSGFNNSNGSVAPELPETLADAHPHEPKRTAVGMLLPAAVILGNAAAILLVACNQEWVSAHQAWALGCIFLLGYAAITVEEVVGLNKAATALLLAITLWTTRALCVPPAAVHDDVADTLKEAAEVLFFLVGAMAVVEVMDANGGFQLLSKALRISNRRRLAWVMAAVTFFMGAMLDSVTTTIVMISILQRLCRDPEARKLLGALVVIAANAGGAWTVIGDVTTTMLWIGGQLTPVAIMQALLLPSAASLLVPLVAFTYLAPELGVEEEEEGWLPVGGAAGQEAEVEKAPEGAHGVLVGAVGLGALLGAPVFRELTGLPPYLGVLGGLAVLWALTDVLHPPSSRELRVAGALQRIDTAGVLFFLGALMAVGALDKAGVLRQLAAALEAMHPSRATLAVFLGVLSCVVDNVPLVAATMGMYPLVTYPPDASLWHMVAYCAGTGGSILVLGSAAGVVCMGLLPGVTSGWYLRRATPWVLLGYGAGFEVYLLQSQIPAVWAAAAGLLHSELPPGVAAAAHKGGVW